MAITVGALVSRKFPVAGFWISLSAMAVYLCVDFIKVIKSVFNFSKVNKIVKLRTAMWGVLLIIIISAVAGRTIHYFFMLVLLGVDYFLMLKSGGDEKNG